MQWAGLVSKFSFLELLGAVFSTEWMTIFDPYTSVKAKPFRPHST